MSLLGLFLVATSKVLTRRGVQNKTVADNSIAPVSGSVYIGKPDGAGNEKFVTTTCPVKGVEVCLHLKTGISSMMIAWRLLGVVRQMLPVTGRYMLRWGHGEPFLCTPFWKVIALLYLLFAAVFSPLSLWR